jgi:uncharacterized membrane protein
MRRIVNFLLRTLLVGALVIVPIYLAILLLLKAAVSVVGLVHPIAKLLPQGVVPADVLSILLVLIACLLVGLALHTAIGRAARELLEKSVFARIPGYALIQSMGQSAAGKNQENVWQPALIEIEEALVPGFIVEEVDELLLTVFVPSVPTPLAGAVYILDRARVHPIDVPFTQAIKSISRWGVGSKALVASMHKTHRPGGSGD